ncbi:radical SAM protein [Candidatus Pacearchaeota archaeon]|nr:radical SAM protein [Candidatus Pacearchaeota archaeon]
MRTKFDSYCLKGIAEGCRYCVNGEKLVLFITGKCSRNCWYCSLSNKRKNTRKTFANEREIRNIQELFEEAKESRAKGAGITGGDPLLVLEKTTKYSRELKKEFGKNFHIHIYLPVNLVSIKNLKKLSKYIDEIRFHPSFLSGGDMEEDIKKIKFAGNLFKKSQIGCEFPCIPDKKKEILKFIKKSENLLGFVNLNELELSETNFNIMQKKYKLNKDTYTIAGSGEAGLWILNQAKKLKIKLHFCTAKTKNLHQYLNRLKRHEILPYGKKTKEGTVIYFIINKKLIMKNSYYDKRKKRTIISPLLIDKLINKYKILRIEEHPTYDRQELEAWEI